MKDRIKKKRKKETRKQNKNEQIKRLGMQGSQGLTEVVFCPYVLRNHAHAMRLAASEQAVVLYAKIKLRLYPITA